MRCFCRPTALVAVAAALNGCAVSATLGEESAATPFNVPPRGGGEPTLEVEALVGRIAFSSEGDIYAMNADGSERTRLTTDPAEDFDPSWSPDGTRIAFRSHRDGDEEVYVMQADGSDQRNLSNAPGTDYSPAWSPKGDGIAFNSDRGGDGSIWVVNAEGSDLRQVTDLPGVSEYPSWSPDGRRIAFHCTLGRVLPGGTGDFEICVVNADGTGFVQLTDAPGESKLPAWSPDGSRIAFQTNREGWPSLPVYEPPGYDPHRYGDFEIFVMESDGSDVTNLTHNPNQDDEFPAWSRDGRLVFSRYGCLTVMDADSARTAQIGACADGGQFPDWWQPGP